MVICVERDADLHMAQLMPLPLTVSCFSKIQIGFTFLVLAHLGSPRKRAVKRVCVCNLCLKINATGDPGCTLFNSECTISAGNTLIIGPELAYTANSEYRITLTDR